MMKNYLPLLVSLTLVSTQIANAQIYRIEKQYNDQVKVKVNGHELKSAWGGGMNHPQFAQADLDHDGLTDLVVYEGFKGISFNGLKTFINMGTAANPDYVYNPDYEYLFPEVKMYMKLIDYNGDKVPDLFHYGDQGMGVCDGFYNNQNRLTFKNCRDIKYTHPFAGRINMPVLNGDIPAIVDIDNDGDLDVLLYDIADNDLLQLYKNTSIEDGVALDSFRMKLKDACWGKATPTYYANREHKLGISCLEVPFAPPGGGGGKPVSKTTGSGNHCITALDIDADGDMDFFDSYIAYPELQLVLNGKVDYGHFRDSMVAQDTTWQSGGIKVKMANFPVAYAVDANTDGLADLLISPYADNSEDIQCVAYYKNTGTATNPAYAYQTDDFVVKEILDAGFSSYPVFYDFDRDGKKDLMIGSSKYDKSSGQIISQFSLYKNTGTGGNVSFEYVTNNVANIGTEKFGSVAPAIGDIDNDGKDELIIGKADGTLALYRNYAASNNLPPVWQIMQNNMTTKYGTLIDVGDKATPCFFDLDKDGKKDLVVGNSTGYLTYLHNDNTVPQEVKLDQVTDKLGGVFVGTSQSGFEYPGYSAPFIGRIDNTQKDYLLVGNEKGVIARYDGVDVPYTANAIFPRLDSVYSNITVKGLYAAPVVTNLDGDTAYMEMYVGNVLGGIYYYKQIFKAGVDEAVGAPDGGLHIYPNPAGAVMHISINNADMQNGIEVLVYNTTGQLMPVTVLHTDKKWMTINTETLPHGVYLCSVRVNGQERYNSVFLKK
jgi:hypothetical protein